ncbi:MAG: pentapeptide repeat-containing protein [Deltaproteobacteria bacterium]|jgi:uncharacterized protein YjbI with pentapeptide repeats|nr:pentapeptide repeat-containing protein [Deltaproteobacteria bacterium]
MAHRLLPSVSSGRAAPRALARPRTLACTLVLACALLGGCTGGNTVGGGADPYSKAYTARDINPNPSILNNAIVKNSDLTGLRLNNVVLKDMTFYNTTSRGAEFKNVVFDNCRLINAKFNNAVLENVTFKGGVITCENDASNIAARTAFTNSRFVNLTLDATYIENPLFSGNNGSLTIRNAHHVIAAQPLVRGASISLTLQNSLFRNMTIAEVTGDSSLTATGCTFEYAHFGNSAFARTNVSRNITYGMSMPRPRSPRARR